MTVVALGSVKGAPGVTTTALALASVWPAARGVVVAEADPDGGVLAARRDLRLEPGVVTLASAVRRGSGVISPHTQSAGTGVRVIAAPPSAEQVRAALGLAGDRLWDAFAQLTDDVLVDCGRLTAASPVLAAARRADVTVLLIRPRLEDVAVLRERVPTLRRAGIDPRVLLMRDGPYHADEVTGAVDAPVLGAVPDDRRTADALDGRSARAPSPRSPLLRSARQIAERLVTVGGVRNGGTR